MLPKTFVSKIQWAFSAYFALVLCSCQSSRALGEVSQTRSSSSEVEAPNDRHREFREDILIRKKNVALGPLRVDEKFLWLQIQDKIQKVDLEGLKLSLELAPAGKIWGWSLRPDGKEMALIAELSDGVYLYIYDGSGKEKEKIRFRDSRRRWDPSLSADGNWVLYSAQKEANSSQVFIEGVNRKTQRSFKLIESSGESISVRFHPTQKRLVWSKIRSSRSDLSDIFVADWESDGKQLKIKHLVNLTQEFWGLHLTPSWLGTQDKVLWASNAESHGPLQLFVYDLTKRCLQKIPGSADIKWMPATSLDSKMLYWISPQKENDSRVVRTSWTLPTSPCVTSNIQGDRNKKVKKHTP